MSEVDFEAAAREVEVLSSKVEEALLSLSPSALVGVGEWLGIRQGRLKQRTGKAKSKGKLNREIKDVVERKCSESPDAAMSFLTSLNNLMEEHVLAEAGSLLTEECQKANGKGKKKKTKLVQSSEVDAVQGSSKVAEVPDSEGSKGKEKETTTEKPEEPTENEENSESGESDHDKETNTEKETEIEEKTKQRKKKGNSESETSDAESEQRKVVERKANEEALKLTRSEKRNQKERKKKVSSSDSELETEDERILQQKQKERKRMDERKAKKEEEESIRSVKRNQKERKKKVSSSESEMETEEERRILQQKQKERKRMIERKAKKEEEGSITSEKRKNNKGRKKMVSESETSEEEELRSEKAKQKHRRRKAYSESDTSGVEEIRIEKRKNRKKKAYSESDTSEVEDRKSERRKLKDYKAKVKRTHGRRRKYDTSSSEEESMRRSDLKHLRKAWRPQLKFTGQYGKTDSWSEFTSLKRLIDQAKAKDPPYEEDEIVEATIRAITAGTDLRKFLEGTPCLTLKLMMETLRSFYSEPEEKDLVQELSNLRQGKDEDAQRFVMRGLDIVHQFEAKKKRRMSKSMAFEMLLEGLGTGFLDENIRTRMQLLLDEPSTTESDLLRTIKRVKKVESDRRSKFDRRPVARVNEVSSTVDDSVMAAVLAKIEGLSTDMADVKQIIHNKTDVNKENTPPFPPAAPNLYATPNPYAVPPHFAAPKILYGCSTCKANGLSSTCRHCFICESPDHRAFECPKKRPSNSKRSPMGTN